MEKEITKHFCTCDDLTCVLNPNNPNSNIIGCDPCIRKNLKAREIPSCFYLLVNEDMTGVEDFTIDGFVEFYLKSKHATKPTNGNNEINEV
jgi:hypothetical protein